MVNEKLDVLGRPAVKTCKQKSLKDRAIMHMCLWDWICSEESREQGYTLATLRLGCSIIDALEIMGELPGNFVYVQGVSETSQREAYGFIGTDKPKAIPEWDSCFFVGVYKDEEEEYKAVTSLYRLADFLPDARFRVGSILMAGKGKTEDVSMDAFMNALKEYRSKKGEEKWTPKFREGNK